MTASPVACPSPRDQSSAEDIPYLEAILCLCVLRFDHSVLLDLALSDKGGISMLSFLLRALKGPSACGCPLS